MSRENEANRRKNRSTLGCFQIVSMLLAQSNANTTSRSPSPSTWYAIWSSPCVYRIGSIA
jgi:hypothetical protein